MTSRLTALALVLTACGSRTALDSSLAGGDDASVPTGDDATTLDVATGDEVAPDSREDVTPPEDAGMCCSMAKECRPLLCPCGGPADCCSGSCVALGEDLGVCSMPFACGAQRCSTPTEFCRTFSGGRAPVPAGSNAADASPIEPACLAMPPGCFSGCVGPALCSCVLATRPCAALPGSAAVCILHGDVVQIDCEVP